MTEDEFSEIVSALCNGDSPVTPAGSFLEVVSYLEGYGKGRAVVKNSHSVFTLFLRWFSNKLGQKQLEIPIRWFQFRELYSSDKEALENLSILYKEYVESSIPQD
ncbi:MAG TPA: hypothetical protein VGC97_23855 [Pyrinomonadaceae bacterium]|jgi:hypothetical protein